MCTIFQAVSSWKLLVRLFLMCTFWIFLRWVAMILDLFVRLRYEGVGCLSYAKCQLLGTTRTYLGSRDCQEIRVWVVANYRAMWCRLPWRHLLYWCESFRLQLHLWQFTKAGQLYFMTFEVITCWQAPGPKLRSVPQRCWHALRLRQQLPPHCYVFRRIKGVCGKLTLTVLRWHLLLLLWRQLLP